MKKPMESKVSLKLFLESKEYQDKKERLSREINMYPLVIDRTVFVKTKQERIQLNNAKSLHKIRVKKEKALK